mmetsp:Transcript_5515/g.13962  ORF Transcript_5515/g.13962 Transcript_5515/m.13962 type:complete len:225 (+) Transcript_5515:315-989(+)
MGERRLCKLGVGGHRGDMIRFRRLRRARLFQRRGGRHRRMCRSILSLLRHLLRRNVSSSLRSNPHDSTQLFQGSNSAKQFDIHAQHRAKRHARVTSHHANFLKVTRSELEGIKVPKPRACEQLLLRSGGTHVRFWDRLDILHVQPVFFNERLKPSEKHEVPRRAQPVCVHHTLSLNCGLATRLQRECAGFARVDEALVRGTGHLRHLRQRRRLHAGCDIHRVPE